MSDADLLRAQMQRELITTSSEQPPAAPLFHYTSSVGLNGILREVKIRATHFMHLNDRHEMKAGEAIVLEVATELNESQSLTTSAKLFCNEFIKTFSKKPLTAMIDVYVASLTEDGNDLAQWRAYGGQGGGYSIGLDARAFGLPRGGSPDSTVGIWLERVVYDEKVMKDLVRTELDRLLNAVARYMDTYATRRGEDFAQVLFSSGMTVLFVQVGALVTRYKNPAFAGEHEWRIVATPASTAPSGTVKFDLRPGGIVPYVDVSLRRSDDEPFAVTHVYVGPTQDPDRGVRAAKQLVRDVGLDAGLVQHSGIPLRSA
jgi:hypothetical protein